MAAEPPAGAGRGAAALADGIWLRMLVEERDFAPTIAAAVRCVRRALDDAR